jgi:hypothetical protein
MPVEYQDSPLFQGLSPSGGRESSGFTANRRVAFPAFSGSGRVHGQAESKFENVGAYGGRWSLTD